ncbi:MAG: zinc dependent phospholipase C family protein [Bacteroidetes bacterium]|nr:zinc dependent phospholipase C family protein [Bacteroidota bacterium]
MSRKKFFLLYFLLPIAYCLLPTSASPWGFFAHKKINQLAVFTLPPEMITFYKKNIDYITAHAVDPDRRRHSNPDEAARHYIDIDHYGKSPFDSVPHHWKDAVKKYSEDTLNAYGIVPWYVETMMYRLTAAFKEENVDRILYLSANIGHYIEDAHVPLHTTENYNGQFTNQKGIHAFWESRIPELFADKWDLFTGKAQFVDKINDRIWQIVKESNAEKDSVLKFEADLNAYWSADKKYSFENKGNMMTKVYSEEYSNAYEKKLNGMVERRMRQSIIDVGSFWFTAWMNAGKPNLDRLLTKEVSDSLKTAEKETEKMWKTGKPSKGHDEE